MKRLEEYWYSDNLAVLLLLPLSYLYCTIVQIRRFLYKKGYLKSQGFPVPVIVVGNITVGGSGKTPCVIYLARYLQGLGYHPGIVSRGYAARQKASFPYRVYPHSEVNKSGDEALLIAERSACPVMIDPQRTRAVQALVVECDVDIIISDDGLQHYALQRDIEIHVMDAKKQLGNGYCLPAGPLREPVARLQETTLQVINGKLENHRALDMSQYVMQLKILNIYSAIHPQNFRTLADFRNKTVHAVTAIGHPERFFQQLRAAGINVIEHAYRDHHIFSQEEIIFSDNYDILMTEKDAVKCRSFIHPQHWIVAVDAIFDSTFTQQLQRLLKEIKL